MTKLPKIQVDKTHYFNLKYDTKERWASYWCQITEVFVLNPKSVLEIGVGNKTVSDYLKKLNLEVTTCDFDKSLKPDVVANVVNLPFKKNSFDVVLCAEVLEHLPFKNFTNALKEIYRVCRLGAVVTLPHFSITHLYLGFKIIPFIPRKELLLKIDLPIKHKFLGEHYWEIGKRGFSTTKIKNIMQKVGFKIEKTYMPVDSPRHQFFVLMKQ